MGAGMSLGQEMKKRFSREVSGVHVDKEHSRQWKANAKSLRTYQAPYSRSGSSASQAERDLGQSTGPLARPGQDLSFIPVVMGNECRLLCRKQRDPICIFCKAPTSSLKGFQERLL